MSMTSRNAVQPSVADATQLSARGEADDRALTNPQRNLGNLAGRRVKLLHAVLLAVGAAAAGAWLAGARIKSPADVALRTAPPPPSPILVPVEERVLSADVVTRGTVRFGLPQSVALAPSPLKAGPGLVTTLPLRNTQLNEGDVILTASGRPVFVLQGQVPAYHDLTPGLSGAARDLRETKRDQGMTQRALNILEAGGADVYERALTALRDDTREHWRDCLSDPPDDGPMQLPPKPLKEWLDHHRAEWYDQPIVELQHRDAIRDQALGIAYGADDLEVPARYEVHLDRKLERTLAMLIRLREFRQPTAPRDPFGKISRRSHSVGRTGGFAPISVVQTSGTISPKRSFVDAAAKFLLVWSSRIPLKNSDRDKLRQHQN